MSSCSLIIRQITFKEMPYIKVTGKNLLPRVGSDRGFSSAVCGKTLKLNA